MDEPKYYVVDYGTTDARCATIKRKWWQFWMPKYREVWTITRSGSNRPTETTVEEWRPPLFPNWIHDAVGAKPTELP